MLDSGYWLVTDLRSRMQDVIEGFRDLGILGLKKLILDTGYSILDQ
jgi:hypothetical protein